MWSDGFFLHACIEDHGDRSCSRIGAVPESKKELIAFQIGIRPAAETFRARNGGALHRVPRRQSRKETVLCRVWHPRSFTQVVAHPIVIANHLVRRCKGAVRELRRVTIAREAVLSAILSRQAPLFPDVSKSLFSLDSLHPSCMELAPRYQPLPLENSLSSSV